MATSSEVWGAMVVVAAVVVVSGGAEVVVAPDELQAAKTKAASNTSILALLVRMALDASEENHDMLSAAHEFDQGWV